MSIYGIKLRGTSKFFVFRTNIFGIKKIQYEVITLLKFDILEFIIVEHYLSLIYESYLEFIKIY